MTRRWACGVLLVAALAVPVSAGATTPVPPEPVDLGGTRVDVSTDPNDPVLLTAGLWADTLTGPGQVDANLHRFRYQRTIENSTVLVGVVATSPEESGDAVEVSVEATDDGAACGSNSSTSGSPAVGSAYGALVVVPFDFGAGGDPCVTSESLDIAVGRGTSTLAGDLPIAIRVVEEAPVSDAEADLPGPIESPDVAVPEPVEPSSLTGGSSFDGAPDITPGATHTDAVPEGAERLYRLRLDWGQALAVRVDIPPQNAAAAAALDIDIPAVNLTLFDPLRNSFDGGAEDAIEDGSYDDDGSSLFDGTRPVTYRNRFDDGLVSVPGDYWVSVAVSPPLDGREPVDVPVELTVDVVGEPGAAPEYREVVTAPGGKGGPEGYDSATPYLVGEGEFSADVSGTPRVPGEDGSGGPQTRTLVGFALAIVSAALCLAGAASLRRRSRQ